jgi:hypothetical protein
MRYHAHFTPRWKARRLYSDAYREGIAQGIALGVIIAGIAFALISVLWGV